MLSTTLTSVEGSNRLATGTLEEEIAALGERRIVVGGGTPYFPPDVHIDLELVETRAFGATVYLRYRQRG